MSGPSSEQAPRSRILAVIFINTIMIISCTSIAILHKTETLSGPAYALGESEWRLRQLTVNGGISASISGDGSRVAFISNPNGQYPLPTRALSVINMDGTGFKQLINTTCGYPSINRDGSRITFNTLSGGNWQVCVINSDGTGFKQLTSTELNYYPSISGDGSKVVFIRDRDIYVINSDGTGLRKVTTNLQIDYSGFESCPSISGNGSRIAFHAYSDYNGDNVTDYCDIFVVNSDGTGLRRLTNYANASARAEHQRRVHTH
jgi:Tol biopolymer transport system component